MDYEWILSIFVERKLLETMILSELSWNIRGTLGRKFLALAKQYDDVVDFTLGDPDIPTPDGICEAAFRAIREHKTRYTASAGLPLLREAIAAYEAEKCGIDIGPENVAITVGATEAIHLAFRMLLNPGDEVIIIGPTWPQCPNDVLLCGGKPIIADRFTEGFLPDLEYVRSLITEKTKIIVVNSPNNPTGTVYPREVIKKISQLADEKGLYVFSDEVYSTLVYDKPFYSISRSLPDKENLVMFNSFSKAFCMTGWRVGYVLGEAHFIKRLVKMQENVAVCVSSVSQWAALEAVTHAQQYYEPLREAFRARRETLLNALEGMPNIKYQVPDATFYLFADISATGLDSRSFCFKLLEQEHVAISPGLSFGDAFDGYIRLAVTLNDDVIREGLGRIRHFLDNV